MVDEPPGISWTDPKLNEAAARRVSSDTNFDPLDDTNIDPLFIVVPAGCT